MGTRLPENPLVWAPPAPPDPPAPVCTWCWGPGRPLGLYQPGFIRAEFVGVERGPTEIDPPPALPDGPYLLAHSHDCTYRRYIGGGTWIWIDFAGWFTRCEVWVYPYYRCFFYGPMWTPCHDFLLYTPSPFESFVFYDGYVMLDWLRV